MATAQVQSQVRASSVVAATTLVPERALLHPTWWSALTLLAVNDHVLKGADILPAVVTGKLSDLAGLFVAGPLLATLLRARSRRQLGLAYFCVGTVFAALQLSPQAVEVWRSGLALVGLSWRIWPDPTDLLALPALWLSWRVAVPAMQAPWGVARPLRALLRVLLTGLGLLFCLATSPPDPVPPCCSVAAITADVYLHNATDQDVVVRIRPLEPDVDLDCDAVGAAPAASLAPSLFATGRTWTLPPQTNLPVREPDGAPCAAVRVEGPELEPTLLFWRAADVATTTVPGYTDPEVGDLLSPGALVIDGPPGALELHPTEVDPTYAPARWAGADEPTAACELVPDADRLAWTAIVPGVRWRLLSRSEGADGCLRLALRRASQAGETPAARWTVCLPSDAWPFQDGDEIAVTDLIPTPEHGAQAIAIDRVAAADPTDERGLTVLISRALDWPGGTALAGALVAIEACPLAAPLGDCGTLERPARLVLGSGNDAQALATGDHVEMVAGGVRYEVFDVRSAQRAVVQASCSEGPARAGGDVEVVIVEWTEAPP